jgi:hypothetical protein
LAQRTGHHGGMSLGADLGTSLEMGNPEIGGQTFVCKNDKKTQNIIIIIITIIVIIIINYHYY